MVGDKKLMTSEQGHDLSSNGRQYTVLCVVVSVCLLMVISAGAITSYYVMLRLDSIENYVCQ